MSGGEGEALADHGHQHDHEGDEDDRSRPGSGAPASVSNGRASAVASDTAPRRPLQAITARPPPPTRLARCAGRRSRARMR